MIGVDTNVLLRLLVADDPLQNAKARTFFEGRSARDPAFVSSIVLAETVWVLRRSLDYPQQIVEQVIRKMLGSPELEIENGSRLRLLLQEGGALKTDISDYLVAWAAEREGCARTVTFDRRAAKNIASMELL